MASNLIVNIREHLCLSVDIYFTLLVLFTDSEHLIEIRYIPLYLQD